MSRRGMASDRQLELPLIVPGDEVTAGTRREYTPVVDESDDYFLCRTAVYVIRTHGGVGGVAP